MIEKNKILDFADNRAICSRSLSHQGEPRRASSDFITCCHEAPREQRLPACPGQSHLGIPREVALFTANFNDGRFVGSAFPVESPQCSCFDSPIYLASAASMAWQGPDARPCSYIFELRTPGRLQVPCLTSAATNSFFLPSHSPPSWRKTTPRSGWKTLREDTRPPRLRSMASGTMNSWSRPGVLQGRSGSYAEWTTV